MTATRSTRSSRSRRSKFTAVAAKAFAKRAKPVQKKKKKKTASKKDTWKDSKPIKKKNRAVKSSKKSYIDAVFTTADQPAGTITNNDIFSTLDQDMIAIKGNAEEIAFAGATNHYKNHEDKRNHFAQDFDCVISNCVVMSGDMSLPITFPKGRVVPKLFVVIGGIVTTLKRELASFAVWQWAKQLQNKR